jgi:electron transfer flavoprotein beta subunit
VIVLVCLESPSPSLASRAALRLAGTLGDKAEIVIMSVGGPPDSASFELARQPLAVRRVVHFQNSALKEPDYLTLGIVLAEAARYLHARVIIAGEHSDMEGQGLVPAALAHHMRAPLFARVQSAALSATGNGIVQMTVQSGGRLCNLTSPLPVVLTTAPAPSMAEAPTRAPGQSSPKVETLSLDQLGVDASLLVPRPGLLGALIPAPAETVQRKSFEDAARILVRGR